MIAFILRRYVWLHEILHKRVISRLGCAIYGIHPKEYFGRRYEFFSMYVGKNDVVIDIACGAGTILYKLKDKIKKGYGVDYSEKQIDLCKKLHSAGNLSYHKVDVLNMDYKHAKGEVRYNVAILSHILEHVEDVPSLLNKVDAEKILICVPSEDHWYRLMMKGLSLDIRTDRSHFREYNIDMLLEELDKAKYHANCAGYNSDGDIVCYAVKNKE
jgi:SAM-dependent methyltransferase